MQPALRLQKAEMTPGTGSGRRVLPTRMCGRACGRYRLPQARPTGRHHVVKRIAIGRLLAGWRLAAASAA